MTNTLTFQLVWVSAAYLTLQVLKGRCICPLQSCSPAGTWCIHTGRQLRDQVSAVKHFYFICCHWEASQTFRTFLMKFFKRMADSSKFSHTSYTEHSGFFLFMFSTVKVSKLTDGLHCHLNKRHLMFSHWTYLSNISLKHNPLAFHELALFWPFSLF